MSAFPKRESARTSDGVTVALTDTVVVPYWDSRQELHIVNAGANPVDLMFATTTHGTPVAVAGKGYRLTTGQAFKTTTYTGAVNAIATTGTSVVTIAEF